MEIARLNQLYTKTGISFAQAKDMPGMIEAHKSGRGVCRFFSNVAEQNGRVTVTYHIYEPRKDGTFLTTVSEDDL